MPERQEAAEGQEEKMYLNHTHRPMEDGTGINVLLLMYNNIIQECMNDII